MFAACVFLTILGKTAGPRLPGRDGRVKCTFSVGIEGMDPFLGRRRIITKRESAGNPCRIDAKSEVWGCTDTSAEVETITDA